MRLRGLALGLLLVPAVGIFALSATSLSLSCYTYRYTVVDLTRGDIALTLVNLDRERARFSVPHVAGVFELDAPPFGHFKAVADLSNGETVSLEAGEYIFVEDGQRALSRIDELVIVVTEHEIALRQLRSGPFADAEESFLNLVREENLLWSELQKALRCVDKRLFSTG
ncbi:MAG: hypothetical protein ACTS10_14000 [Kiloniellales bacterium]